MTETPQCPQCGVSGVLITRRGRVRREGHVVPYTAQAYQCEGCSESEDPYVYVTEGLRELNAQAAADAWAKKVGGEIPERKKTGRKSLNPYTEQVTFKESAEGMALVAELRRRRGQGTTIAKLFRALIREEAARSGLDAGTAGGFERHEPLKGKKGQKAG